MPDSQANHVGSLTEKVSRVIAIAGKVRDAFEEIGKNEQYPSNLCGLCLRASAQLFAAAADFGIDIQIIGGIGHCFNMCDGYIIDVTATQFGEIDRVLVVHPANVAVRQSSFSSWKKESVSVSLEEAYARTWNEAPTFTKDRLVVLKHTASLTGESTWLGKESAAYT